MSTNTRLSPEDISKLPSQPGIYKYFNSSDKLIYVGKAKNLKKRVASYFTKSHIPNRKTLRMVSEISGIEITIVNSEFDALLLENNLIKQHQPRYNINLKDDKSFPFICITNERFPRIISTRRYKKTSGEYFGPYTSVRAMKNVLDLIRKLHTIRTCKLNLSQKNIESGKFKVCLEYHLKNCLGPCEGLQEEGDYNEEIDNTREILKGNLGVVKNYFKKKMESSATKLDFELAQKYKLKHELLEKFQSRSIIVNQKLTDIDVFTLVSDEKAAVINFLRIVNGAINLSDTIMIKKKLDETDQDILSLLIENYRLKFGKLSKNILTNIPVVLWDQSETFVPERGDKKKLIELSIKNGLYYKKEQLSATSASKNRNERVLENLQKDLHLKTLPKHIECFDNSNIQGTNPVASMVCFISGRPAKKEYRHYNIKSVVGPDDFKSMKEVVTRRYDRLNREEKSFPDLIVIDGGKGQLNAASEALKDLSLYGKIPLIGIAKKLEEIYFPEDPLPVHLSKKSESLLLLQRIRDEAHRFAITFHRNKRSSGSLISSLDKIDGIGPGSRDKLLKHYQSMAKIRAAGITDLSLIVGLKKAQLVHDYFNSNKKSAS